MRTTISFLSILVSTICPKLPLVCECKPYILLKSDITGLDILKPLDTPSHCKCTISFGLNVFN